ncbi:PREDICTED: location of vulva defective 1-like [Branchiostoma belcheri]|uniref:Location of vulva defective 1-like n=1 Tax=Branchiostoma belcheri TaxID=7741 RepID=A0A6P4ZVS0_BRABE|nr:PREDICTED: location of vulva defective 1-like [Branchiostoma belcheri]
MRVGVLRCGEADAVGLWPLNSQYGASDASGNGNDGVATGTQLAPGPNGDPDGAFLFSGTVSSYIDIPNNGRLDVRLSYTILANIYPTGYDGPIFNYVGNNNDHLWAIHFWQTSHQALFLRTIGRHTRWDSIPPVSANVLQQNAWNYVGGTYDSSTGVEAVWNDGELVAQLQIGVPSVASQYAVRVAVKDGDRRYFAGRIACIQLYDFAMTQEQIVSARDRCASSATTTPAVTTTTPAVTITTPAITTTTPAGTTTTPAVTATTPAVTTITPAITTTTSTVTATAPTVTTTTSTVTTTTPTVTTTTPVTTTFSSSNDASIVTTTMTQPEDPTSPPPTASLTPSRLGEEDPPPLTRAGHREGQ